MPNNRNNFSEIPVQLRLLFADMYIISGPKCIQEIWKAPDLHNKAYKSLSLQTMFKMPKDTLAFWMEDDSGSHAQPRPESQVSPHLRIDYLIHSSVSRLLTGNGLKPFARRFTSNLNTRLLMHDAVHPDWSVLPDLFGLLQAEMFPAAVEAMCGKRFFPTIPTFVEDFWAFSAALPKLAKKYPRWMFPKAYEARDKCFASIEGWHRAIWPCFNNPTTDSDGWNEDWGAVVIKSRHMGWSKMPRVGAQGAATEDLGLIWACVKKPLFHLRGSC